MKQINQTMKMPMPRGGNRTVSINQSSINMLYNYLQKNKRSKDKTSPLEEYEMKRKEKMFSIHGISDIPLRESSASVLYKPMTQKPLCGRAKPFDFTHTHKGSWYGFRPQLAIANGYSIAYGKMASSI